MDDGSRTITLTARPRKRSISAHRHSTTDSHVRGSLIKTKIQKIDGQYKASPTCPISSSQEQANSSDDPDEPLIVATLPPFIQNSSQYRTRQDVYDDEAGDDQQSNSSSHDCSPIDELVTSNNATIQNPLSTNENTNEVSLNTFLMPEKTSTHVINEENVPEKSITIEQTVITQTKLTKKTTINKSASSISSSVISIEPTNSSIPTNQPVPSTLNSSQVSIEDNTNKSPIPVEVNVSNTKQSHNPSDPSKLKVRVTTTTTKPTKTNTKSIPPTKTNLTVEQKPIKKLTTIQKETVIPTKKPVSTVPSKKIVKPSIKKPSLNNSNSEKPPGRPSSITPTIKVTEKKLSDSPSATTVKKTAELPRVKPSPVTFGKIPKLNPANKPKIIEKPVPSKNLTGQKLDLLGTRVSLPSNTTKPLNTPEKNLLNPPRLSPARLNRSHQNTIDHFDPMAPLSPMDLDDSLDAILGRHSSTSNQYSTSKYSRANSIGHDNTQSQSPLSPGPSSTLYPPPSPPTVPPLPSRSIPPVTTTFLDSRYISSHLPPSNHEHPKQTLNRIDFSKPPVAPLVNPVNIPSVPVLLPASVTTDYQDNWATNKSNHLWDSASSDEDVDDDTNARRFFQQNMRAVDEELSKVGEISTTTPPAPIDSRTEELLKRQKKAVLSHSSSAGGVHEEIAIEPSASVDDFECVAMDLDSPKHRTQSESSENKQTTIESTTNQGTINGSADSKIAELSKALSTDTSKKYTSKNRPLKTTSMTLIDELKNSINPSLSSKQSILSPTSRSLSRSRSRTRSRSRSRSHSRSHSRSSPSSSSSTSSSSHTRRSRSRRRTSKRRSSKHHQRHRTDNYNDDHELSTNNHNNYPSASMHQQSNHHHHHHPHPHPPSIPLPPPPPPHHHNPSVWPPVRQNSNMLSGPPPPPLPPPPPPPLSYGHQQPVPPLLPHHSYYPQSNRSLMHHQPQSVDSSAGGNGRFNFQHNHHPRNHPPLMHAPYYHQGPPQPLMQPSSHPHHPHPSMNRYPPPLQPQPLPLPLPPRPFDLPPHPSMSMGNAGPHLSNPNYNQYKYESEERLAQIRAKRDVIAPGTNINNNRRGGPPPSESIAKTKINNPPKSVTKSSDHQNMDQLVLAREKLLAELNEISDSGDIDDDHSSSYKNRSISSNSSQQSKPTAALDDEGEEGEISESD